MKYHINSSISSSSNHFAFFPFNWVNCSWCRRTIFGWMCWKIVKKDLTFTQQSPNKNNKIIQNIFFCGITFCIQHLAFLFHYNIHLRVIDYVGFLFQLLIVQAYSAHSIYTCMRLKFKAIH